MHRKTNQYHSYCQITKIRISALEIALTSKSKNVIFLMFFFWGGGGFPILTFQICKAVRFTKIIKHFFKCFFSHTKTLSFNPFEHCD